MTLRQAAACRPRAGMRNARFGTEPGIGSRARGAGAHSLRGSVGRRAAVTATSVSAPSRNNLIFA